jgi:riboflavin synthase
LAEAALVPHTLAQTNLGRLAPGDRVNLEVDILAKYVEKLLDARFGASGEAEGGGLDRRKLAEHGFL